MKRIRTTSLFKAYGQRGSIRRLMAVACLTLVFAIPAGLSAQTIRFRDYTKTYKVPGNVENGASCYGHGVALADINGDSRPDIYIANAVRDADELPETLYISVPGGYQENDQARGVSDPYGWTGSHGIVFFDYDNDGDYDLFNSTTDDRNRLYRNKDDGFYEDVTTLVGLPLISFLEPDFDPNHTYGYGTRAVVAFDANNDGYMDLYGVNWGPAEKRYANPATGEGDPIVTPVQPNEFYLNVERNGQRGYQMITNSGATPDNPKYMGTQGVTVVDVDEDNDMDIYVCHRNYIALDDYGNFVGGPQSIPCYNQLFLNSGSATFTEGAGAAHLNDMSDNDCNGTTFADFDNDGDYDAFVVHKEKNKVRIYRNDGHGIFTNITDQMNISGYGFSVALFDADNDGDLDLFITRTRNTSLFYRQDGIGNFNRVDDTGIMKKSFDPRGIGIGDFNNDGLLDVYYADANKDQYIVSASYPDTIGNHLFLNQTQTSNRWLKVTGRGPKGDMGGFGSKIWVYDRGYLGDKSHLVGYRQVINSYGYLCQDDPVQHFGLGQRDTVDVRIRLMDGTTLQLYRVLKNQRLFFGKPMVIAKESGDTQLGKAGVALAAPLRVRVRDAFNNILYGAAVTFTALTPGGQVAATQPVYTDANGYAQTTYIPVAGVAAQTIRASLDNGTRQEFTCTIEMAVSYQLYSISGDGQSGPVNENLPDQLVVQVRNQDNQAASALALRFKVLTGGGKVGGADSLSINSGADGKASATWRLGSALSADQKVRAFIVSDRSKYVDFTARSWGAPAELLWLSGTNLSGPVNRSLADSLTAKVVDADGHPMRQATVTFGVTAGGGLVNGSTVRDVLTNREGLAKCQWRLGTKAGTLNNRLQISASVPKGSPVGVQASGLPGAAARLVKISGDNQTAKPEQLLDSLVVAAVVDSFDNPIAEQVVSVTRENPSGPSTVMESDFTDALGRVYFHWRLGTLSGVYRFILQHDGVIPVVFFATASEPKPATLNVVSGDQQIGLPGQWASQPLLVRPLDDQGQPMPGQTIQFISGNGSGDFSPAATVISDTLGLAQVRFRFGAAIGAYPITARIDGTEITASFELHARSTLAQRMEVVGGDQQIGRPGLELADPLDVKVLDELGQPMAGVTVEFLVSSGGGQVTPASSQTGPAGEASGRWTLGYAGEQKVTARVQNQTDVVAYFIAALQPNHAPILSCPADTTILEGSVLQFKVQVSDPDGDPVLVTAENLPPGAQFDVVSRIFFWQPGFQQAGGYTVQLTAEDNQNPAGRTQFNVLIVVRNVNRPPVVLQTLPSDSLVHLIPYRPQRFSVQAIDADGDSLRFIWTLNGAFISSDSAVTILPTPAMSLPAVLKARVLDADNSVEHSWKLDLVSAVKNDERVVGGYELVQNYPNPFNPTTHIDFNLPVRGLVRLCVFNTSGQRIAVLADQEFDAGSHSVIWNAKNNYGIPVPSGIYYASMECGSFKQIIKMALLK